MSNYKIFTTDEYDKYFRKLNKDLQTKIDNEVEQLETNPYVGKPLGYIFLREKKVMVYRIYYLIYEEYKSVFLVSISQKKNQQRTINTIKLFLDYYKGEMIRRISE